MTKSTFSSASSGRVLTLKKPRVAIFRNFVRDLSGGGRAIAAKLGKIHQYRKTRSVVATAYSHCARFKDKHAIIA